GDRSHGRPRARRRRVARARAARGALARWRGSRRALPGGAREMSAPLFGLLVATGNKGKLVELRALLADLPVEIVPLATALPEKPLPVEDGATFEANALIKARSAASAAMMVTLAEDSELEVDAIGGRPSVQSARFARDSATDAENNAALLEALEEIEDDLRRARFR